MLETTTPEALWESELSLKAPNTQSKYRAKFKSFCERWNTNPQELYDQRLADLSSGDALKFRRMEKMLEIALKEFVESGRAASTAKTMQNAVVLFFSAVNLPLSMKKRNTPNGESLGQKMMRIDQQLKLHASLNRYNKKRNATILLILKDSGMRVSDIQLLTIENFRNAEVFHNEAGEEFRAFDPALTEKCKIKGFMHLGPESIKAIKEYLEEREERDLIEGCPTLFVNRRRRAYVNDAMGSMISAQCRLIGPTFNKLSAHSLRKFHRSMLLDAGVPFSWIDVYQGKKPDTYTRPGEINAPHNLNKLTERYIAAYDTLRIFGLSQETKTKLREAENLRNEKTDVVGMMKRLMDKVESISDRLEKIENDVYG